MRQGLAESDPRTVRVPPGAWFENANPFFVPLRCAPAMVFDRWVPGQAAAIL